MGCNFTILRDAGFVVTRFFGRVTDDEFVGLYRKLLTDPCYDSGLVELADLRHVGEFAVTLPALRTVDVLIRTRLIRSDGCQTLIVAPDNVSYGLARMYAALADGGPEQVHVFRTLEEASMVAGRSVETLSGALAGDLTPAASSPIPSETCQTL